MRDEGVWLRKGERVENGGGGVFSLGPPFKRKKFSLQFDNITRENSEERVCLM